jgi:molybdopterin synthase sulfur carrier subunit
MPCEVRIPAPLRSLTCGLDRVDVGGSTVRLALRELEKRHAGLLDRICEGGGELRSYVNIYVNDIDIRSLKGLDTALGDGDTVFIVPAIAGG